MTNYPAAKELASRLSSVALGATRSNKYDELRDWLSETLDLPVERIGVKVISQLKQLGNRIGELRGRLASSNDRLAILLLTACTAEQVARFFEGDWIRADGFEAIVVVEKPRWHRTAVLFARSGSDAASKWAGVFGHEVQVQMPQDGQAATIRASKPVVDDDPAALADELLVDRSWLDRALWLLRDRRALVLYGPPGTGKTWIARKIAEWFAPRAELRTLVQFHPTYAYEDFVEGWRPLPTPGAMSLDLIQGPLLRLAEDASDSPEDNAVLVIDELNRGFVPKVFGELFFLLEYRDEPVRLMYSSTTFSLPPNLYFIATMNTADRSLASLDQALRRRFHFVSLFPGESPVKEMFTQWLHRHNPNFVWLSEALDRVNRMIGDRDIAIGPSHFMRADLDDEVLGWIWESSVLPTISEIFHGTPDRIASFALENIRKLAVV